MVNIVSLLDDLFKKDGIEWQSNCRNDNLKKRIRWIDNQCNLFFGDRGGVRIFISIVSHSDKKLQFRNMDKKTKIRTGLFFGIAMAIFFILQNLLTHSNLTTKDVVITIVSGLFGGALSGLLFGWLVGLFANSKRVTKDTKIDTEANETILFDTGANHFKGAEAVGGKLYLTDKRLVFKSHKFNIQNHKLSINLSDIEKVDRYKTLGLVNNGLSVTTTGNRIEKFVVQQPDKWFSQLIEKKGLQQLH